MKDMKVSTVTKGMRLPTPQGQENVDS